ncbi:GGDEF domain-containing protein [Aurantimonas sp. 22II-16-19i]|uniref:GGDEF domain-containing protein n=1 Tax=Aurantimonas sp. 22II-16-19i TaxID=1317114 RepID=UPI0009F7C415|nr:GGDEF domain-containing protein [Aurantimonas sp. 22II-16-19i]ORE99054.1 diguanylate cyclase [Aurantimonas sp. 22II-16-19i]
MIRRWLKAPHSLDRAVGLLLIATCMLAALAVLTSMQIQRNQREILRISSYDLPYVYARTQVEILRLQAAIGNALVDDTSSTPPRLHWAIVKSRVSTIPVAVGPIDVPEAAVASRNLDRTLNTIEPLIASLGETNNGIKALTHLDRSVREFTQLASLANVRQTLLFEREQGVLSRTMAWLSVNLVLLCLSGFTMLLLVFRRKRQLREIAVTDVLTGLPNRAAIQNWLPGNARPVTMALALVDVDKFKQVNDELGHATGDDLLRRLADVLRDQAGPGTLAARLGGDEFVVMFTGDDARQRARRQCAAITRAFHHASRTTGFARVTLSIGIAVGEVASVPDIEQLMTQADRAMYVSKRKGGDGQTFSAEDCPCHLSADPLPMANEDAPVFASRQLEQV